jgi:hypothetical protein
LAPPPQNADNPESLKRGAAVFDRAGCVACHSGRYFTNNRVIAQTEVGTQPSRAPTLAPFTRIFTDPKTYPSSVAAPPPSDTPVLDVPTDITPKADLELAFGANKAAGGYKVPSLIGLAVTAPYLHDGGVAAGPEALKQPTKGEAFQVANAEQLGMVGTSLQWLSPDPSASLRILVDRTLRQAAIRQNRANPDLQRTHIDGSGHNYWVDKDRGFTVQDQTDLIQFLLSLDDDPQVLLDAAR